METQESDRLSIQKLNNITLHNEKNKGILRISQDKKKNDKMLHPFIIKLLANQE